MSFAGLRVLSLESRRAKEMQTLILRHGGVPFVAPSVKEKASEDRSAAVHFVEQLEGGEFDAVICMTGSGIQFLRDAVQPVMPLERLSAALCKVSIISRGPKPVSILRTLGVPIHLIIPEPNSWKEIVTAMATRPERRIAIQEYGRPNPEMNAALEQLGAAVHPIVLYQWELPENTAPLEEAARRLAAGDVDVVLFTSSIQLDHLLQIADKLGLQPSVIRALTQHKMIASVGPVMTAALQAHGISAAIIPNHPKMPSLVKAAADFVANNPRIG